MCAIDQVFTQEFKLGGEGEKTYKPQVESGVGGRPPENDFYFLCG